MIPGVNAICVPPEDLKVIIRVVKVAYQRLAWSSLDTLLEMLESVDSTSVGADDGYNMSASAYTVVAAPTEGGWGRPAPVLLAGETLLSAGEVTWMVTGSCGYGSQIAACARGFSVASCGGHWVSWQKFKGWDCDSTPSLASWGDSPQEGEDTRSAEQIRAERIASLKAIDPLE